MNAPQSRRWLEALSLADRGAPDIFRSGDEIADVPHAAAMRLAIKNHQAQEERQTARSFDLEAAPIMAPRVDTPAAPTTSVSAIAQPTGLTVGMSDAERAFAEKQNARKEEMRKSYFSPEAKAKLQVEMADKNDQGVTPGTSTNADPSIAKAKAAGVDTKVFGVPLGEPLSLPRCATANERKRETRSNDLANPLKNMDLLGAFRGVQTSTTCQSEGAMMAFMGAMLGGKGADRYILLSKESCPNWAYCEVVASLL